MPIGFLLVGAVGIGATAQLIRERRRSRAAKETSAAWPDCCSSLIGGPMGIASEVGKRSGAIRVAALTCLAIFVTSIAMILVGDPFWNLYFVALGLFVAGPVGLVARSMLVRSRRHPWAEGDDDALHRATVPFSLTGPSQRTPSSTDRIGTNGRGTRGRGSVTLR